MRRLGELLQAGVIDWDTYGRAVRQAQADFDGAAEAGSEWRDITEDQLGGWLDGIIDGTFRARDALKDFAAQAAKMAANKLLMNLLDGAFGGRSVNGGSFISSLFGGFRAMGGDVQPGKGFVVGEHGPEYFQPRQSGTIVPNHALGGGGTAIKVEVINRSSQPIQATPGERSADGAFQRLYLDDMVQSRVPGGLQKAAPAFGLRKPVVQR